MLKRMGVESNGKLPHLFILGKTAAWFLCLRWGRPAFGRTAALVSTLAVRTALGQNTDDDNRILELGERSINDKLHPLDQYSRPMHAVGF